MRATKILNSDIETMKVSSLPSRPTAPVSLGGMGYTAAQMKEAFDKLPLYLVEKFNELLDDISDKDDGLLAALKTGISEHHSLADLIADITDGTFASYLKVSGGSLDALWNELKGMTDSIDDRLILIERLAADKFIDGGKCTNRRILGGDI